MGTECADNDVRDFFKLLFINEGYLVQELVDKAFLFTIEDVYEFGCYSYEIHRKLLGADDCHKYLDVITGLVIIMNYIKDTLKVPMDTSDESRQDREWTAKLKKKIRATSLRREVKAHFETERVLFESILALEGSSRAPSSNKSDSTSLNGLDVIYNRSQADSDRTPVNRNPSDNEPDSTYTEKTTLREDDSVKLIGSGLNEREGAQEYYQSRNTRVDNRVGNDRNRHDTDDRLALARALTESLRDSGAPKLYVKPTIRVALNNKIKWNGKVDSWPMFRRGYEGWLFSSGQKYVLQTDFQKAYIDGGWSYAKQYAPSPLTQEQFEMDLDAQWGALIGACAAAASAQRFLLNKNSDGLRAWRAMMAWIDTEGNVDAHIAQLRTDLMTPYDDRFPGGIMGYLDVMATSYAALELSIENHPDCGCSITSEKEKLMHVLSQFKNHGEEAAILFTHYDKNVKSGRISFDRFMDDVRTQVAYTGSGNSSYGKRRAKLVNTATEDDPSEFREVLQAYQQGRMSMDDLFMSKPMMRLLTAIDPEIVKKFFDARKAEQQVNKTLVQNAGGMIPKQYGGEEARRVQFATGKDDNEDSEDSSDDEEGGMSDIITQLSEALLVLSDNRSGLNVIARAHVDYIDVCAHLVHRTGAFLTVSDGGADTWILGKGWRVLFHTKRYANLIGFDRKHAKKNGLPIVNGAAVVTTSTGEEIIVIVNQGVLNESSEITLMSEYQTREYGNVIDSVSKKHAHWDGTTKGHQAMLLKYPSDVEGEEVMLDFDVNSALMTFNHREPTDEEMEKLPRYVVTSPITWAPQAHFDMGEEIAPFSSNEALVYKTEMGTSRTISSLPEAVTDDSASGNGGGGGDGTEILIETCDQNSRGSLAQAPISVSKSGTDNHQGAGNEIQVETCDQNSRGSVTQLPISIEMKRKSEDDDDEISEFDEDETGAKHNDGNNANGTEFVEAMQYEDKEYYFDTADNEIIDTQKHAHLYYFDPDDNISDKNRLGRAFHLTMDYDFIRESEVDAFLDSLSEYEMTGGNEPFDTYAYGVRTAVTLQDAAKVQSYLGYRPLEVCRKTLENTTQLAALSTWGNMKQHLKSLYPWANKLRINETVATDTYFADTTDVSGATCSQVFYGLTSHNINAYGMKSENEGPSRLQDFGREEGIPNILRSDNSKMQRYGRTWVQILRDWLTGAEFCEPMQQQQNPAELRAIKWLKQAVKVLMRRTGAPRNVWFYASKYMAEIHNVTSDETLGDKTPYFMRRGVKPDISPYLVFQFYERVRYLDVAESFPSTKEKTGYIIGVAKHVGDLLTWEILTEDTEWVIERSVVRSAITNENKAVPFLDDKPLTEKEVKQEESDDESVTSLPSFGNKRIAVRKDVQRRNRLRAKKQSRRLQRRAPKDLKAIEALKALNDKRSSENDAALGKATMTILEDDDEWFDAADDEDIEDSGDGDQEAGELAGNEWSVEQESKGSGEATVPIKQRKQFDRYALKPPNQDPPPMVTRNGRNVRKPTRYATLARMTVVLAASLLPQTASLLSTHNVLEQRGRANSLRTETVKNTFLDTPVYAKDQGVSDEQLRYVQMCDTLLEEGSQEADDLIWKPLRVSEHRVRRTAGGERKAEVKVSWLTEGPSWHILEAIRAELPYVLIDFVMRRAHQHLLKHKDFKWVKEYTQNTDKMTNVVRAFKVSVDRMTPKYKFGVEVARDVRHSLELDRQNDDTIWRDAIETELKQINEYKTFRLPEPGEELDQFTRIPYHFVFDVKFDGRRKARLVAGGNHTTPPKEDIYSGVVGIESIRIGLLIAELNGLQVCAADIGNAFLYGKTKEKVMIRAGKEFGAYMADKILIVDKSLYGLRSSSARFHEHLSAKLRRMGFTPTKADPDFWIKDCGTHYEYIARYIDDVLAFGKDALKIIQEIQNDYILKGIGRPEYYLGGDVIELDNSWKSSNVALALGAKTYAKNVVEKFERVFGAVITEAKSPMSGEYHPEMDETPLLAPKDVSLYRGLIGSANWMITLGRFDIAYATSALARFSMSPREGHISALKRVFGYIKRFPGAQILVDTNFHVPKMVAPPVDYDWQEFYPDAAEELPPGMPEPKGKAMRMTVYKDADHAHDLVTRRSVTGVLMFLNNMPVTWLSKRQKTVETSTYGSELVAARMATELIIEYRYMLRMFGVPIDGPTLMLGDNMSVLLSTSVPSSQLRKKHNAIAYHRVREAIAGGVIRFAKVLSADNFADVLTKPLPKDTFLTLINPILFRKPDSFTAAKSIDGGEGTRTVREETEKQVDCVVK